MEFLHLGEIGDVIYSLPTVQQFKGTLRLGTQYHAWADQYQNYLPVCPVRLTKVDAYGKESPQGLTESMAQQLADLCNACDGYNMEVVVDKDNKDIAKDQINLMEWRILKGIDPERDEFLDYRYLNLAQCHGLAVVRASDFNRTPSDSTEDFKNRFVAAVAGEGLWNDPWMRLKNQPAEVADTVLMARSCRNDASKKVWETLIKSYPHAQFVGDPGGYEFMKFREMGFSGEQVQTESLIELAKQIAKCSLFIGNQSAPFAIAIALGKPVILAASTEAPNCMFHRKNSGVIC
mgnify:CR=1 FL=1